VSEQTTTETGPGPGLVYSAFTGRLAQADRASARWRLIFSAIWLLYLIQPVADLFGEHKGAGWIAAGLVLVIAFSAVYVTALVNWVEHPERVRRVLPLLFGMAILGCLAYGGKGKDWSALWLFVSAASGLAFTSRRAALRAVAAAGACFVFFSWLAHDPAADYLITLLPVLVVGVAVIGLRTRAKLMRELAQAREEVARLAASEERLRLARDMHDLTGQSLSMITLKSELAAKFLQAGDNSKTREQLEEVAAISRQTLHDIREAVSGYRRPTLAVETITARAALTAAGIETSDDPRLITASGTFDSDKEAALAWCLREAVTNVIRHSGARTCAIELTQEKGELTLTVSDDGRGLNSQLGTGNGLRGMSERLATVGGHIRIAGSGGFTLSATVNA
jgi:two-component system sensor histidine kinase DesK